MRVQRIDKEHYLLFVTLSVSRAGIERPQGPTLATENI